MTATLPDALGETFTVAQAQALGVGPSILRRLPAPHRGVRSRRELVTVEERARAATLVLPDGAVFSHTTAAQAHGLWLPRGASDGRLEVMVDPASTPPRLPTVRGHRGRTGIARVAGLDVSTPPDVVVQLASRLALLDLAVLVDSVVRWRSPWTLEQVADVLVPGARGVARARRALALARPGSNSARESLLRLWCHDAGLPEPELNAAVVAGDRREFADLLWREQGVVAEYHGGYHFESDAQRLRDLDRSAWFRRQGLYVAEVTRLDLASTARRDDVLDELAGALGVVPVPRGRRGRTLQE